MKILVGCEESQAVTIELRKLGHEAYSCDLLPCSGGHPEWHLQMDIKNVLNGSFTAFGQFWTEAGTVEAPIKRWDMMIAFPTCTYLTVSANKWYKDQPPRKSGVLVGAERRKAREQAIQFFMDLYNCKIPKIAIENPIGIMSSRFRKPNQIIHPYMFGSPERKGTCLWLKNLPELIPTNIVEPNIIKLSSGKTMSKYHYDSVQLPQEERSKLRSKTFPGIAKAMADQWTKKTSIMKPKTPKEITKLNYNDIAFFFNKSASDAKWDMSTYFYSTEKALAENLTKSGTPKIGINDLVDKSEFETKIKSCSKLEGQNYIDTIIESYNKGIPMERLRKYSESSTFINAMKFTGKHKILNEILNKDQLLKLQKTWLLRNTLTVDYWTKKCTDFIKENDWCIPYLEEYISPHEKIEQQLKKAHTK